MDEDRGGSEWQDHKHEQEAPFIQMGKAPKDNVVADDCARGGLMWFRGRVALWGLG